MLTESRCMRTSSGWSTLFRSTFSREGCPFASFIHKRVLYWEASTARKPSAKQYMYLAVVMEPNHWDSMLRTVVVASCIDTVSWWSPVVVIPGCYICFEINLNHWGVAKISKDKRGRKEYIHIYVEDVVCCNWVWGAKLTEFYPGDLGVFILFRNRRYIILFYSSSFHHMISPAFVQACLLPKQKANIYNRQTIAQPCFLQHYNEQLQT